MLTESHICEGLSRAYVQAVAARAGCNCSVRAHDYGIDGTFLQVAEVGGELVEEGATINFQLKSSSPNLVKVRDEAVSYKLDARCAGRRRPPTRRRSRCRSCGRSASTSRRSRRCSIV